MMIIKTDLLKLTDSRDKHDTEASKYGKLISYSKGTQRIKDRYYIFIVTM